MAENASTKQWSRYWIADDVGGIELIHARFHGQRFVPHTHDSYTMGVILEGALGFDHERRRGLAPAGSVSVVNPGELHTGFGAGEVGADSRGWAYRNFFLPAPLMLGVAEELGLSDLPFFASNVIDDPVTVHALLHLHRILDRSTDPLERQAVAFETLSELIGSHGVPGASTVRETDAPESIRRALERMHDTPEEALTLDVLAEDTGLSRFRFLRLFRRHVGFTPHAYLNQLRVRRAKARILEGHDLAGVAVDCGFSDQSHLNRRCKEVYGLTPGMLARGARPRAPHPGDAQATDPRAVESRFLPSA